MNITVKNLTKTFNDKIVLKNLNLEFSHKKINCIMGPSGCGKTTLINILLGMEKADSGKIEGMERIKVAAVFQEDRLCEGFSAVANIRLVCNDNISDKSICDNLKEVGLYEAAQKEVSKLSGGMKRRVAIVRAMMAEANIIIMDEPFKGLDDKTKMKVINYVKKYGEGKTLIITTHNIEEIDMLKATLIKM